MGYRNAQVNWREPKWAYHYKALVFKTQKQGENGLS